MDSNEDFGFVQRDSSVLEMAERGSNKGSEGGAEDEDDVSVCSKEGEEGEGGSAGNRSPERKSGDSGSSPEVDSSGRKASGASTTTEQQVARDDGSASGEVTKGKAAAGRLLRTMSAYMSSKSEKPTPNVDPTLNDLPQTFLVKYLGRRDARGLWGIKHTRRPVDEMVSAAKGANGQPPAVLPLVKLTVSKEGVTLTAAAIAGTPERKIKKGQKDSEPSVFHPIETISYGVQDLVYTRVFSMIIVREGPQLLGAGQNMQHPFQCHGFVCDSRSSARRMTYVLAAAFQEFSRLLKKEEEEETKSEGSGITKKRRTFKKFAIDLRTPEQIEQDLKQPESEA